MSEQPLCVYFLTTNRRKLNSMRKLLKPLNITVYSHPLSPRAQPERKQDSVESTARYKILDHKSTINAPFVVHDGGFFLDALAGFPGAHVNHVLDTIGVRGILELVPEAHRTCHFHDVLAFWSPALERSNPNSPIRYFHGQVHGSVAKEPSGVVSTSAWSDLWSIFIPDGFTTDLASMKGTERHRFSEMHDKAEENPFISFARWIEDRTYLLFEQEALPLA